MKLNFVSENVYIPKWNENKKEKENQIKVYWKYPTYSERKRIKYFSNPKVNNIGSGSNPEIEFIIDFEMAIKLCIVKIENLEVNNKSIVSSKDLIECGGLSGLADEIGGVIIKEMDEVKNNSKN